MVSDIVQQFEELETVHHLQRKLERLPDCKVKEALDLRLKEWMSQGTANDLIVPASDPYAYRSQSEENVFIFKVEGKTFAIRVNDRTSVAWSTDFDQWNPITDGPVEKKKKKFFSPS